MTEYKYKVSDFEGPLDLLLYLIEKNKVDIYNIPIVEITDQFNAYVADIDTFDVDYASKFFVMAATLLQIKSRLLLPKPKNISAAEADPKQDLIERLENYLRIKQAAERLGQGHWAVQLYQRVRRNMGREGHQCIFHHHDGLLQLEGGWRVPAKGTGCHGIQAQDQ